MRAVIARALLAVGLVGAACSAPRSVAWAQADPAAAEALFRRGRQLLEEGAPARACEAFAESQRLDPSPGTLLNLGLCAREQGKVASAWAHYLSAERLARARGRDRVAEEARAQAAELEPRLSFAVISARGPEAVRVEVDGVLLRPAALAERLPMDPGEHQLRATAKGHVAFVTTFAIPAERQSVTVVVPVLAPVAPDETDVRDVAPWVAMGAGAAAVVASGVTGTLALLDEAQLADECADDLCPSRSLRSRQERAQDLAVATDVLLVSGAALALTGLALYLWLPDEQPPATGTAEVACRVSGCGLHLRF